LTKKHYTKEDLKHPGRFCTRDNILDFLQLTFGAIIAAFALEEFLSPNHLFDGGVTGISMILDHYIKLPLAVFLVILNVPFLLLGAKIIEKSILVKAAYSMTLFAVFTYLFEPLANATDDIFLAVCFGGVILGVGVGLVLRGGGCLDGTEIIGIVINKRHNISVGTVVLIINVVIFGVAGICFGLDRGMYSLVMYYITSKLIDIIEIGWDNAKSVMIITEHGKELADEIYEELGRTVTFMRGEGFVSQDHKDILYCVVTRAEIHDLKAIIHSVPGSTFTTISEVSEIVGTHIKSTEK